MTNASPALILQRLTDALTGTAMEGGTCGCGAIHAAPGHVSGVRLDMKDPSSWVSYTVQVQMPGEAGYGWSTGIRVAGHNANLFNHSDAEFLAWWKRISNGTV